MAGRSSALSAQPSPTGRSSPVRRQGSSPQAPLPPRTRGPSSPQLLTRTRCGPWPLPATSCSTARSTARRSSSRRARTIPGTADTPGSPRGPAAPSMGATPSPPGGWGPGAPCTTSWQGPTWPSSTTRAPHPTTSRITPAVSSSPSTRLFSGEWPGLASTSCHWPTITSATPLPRACCRPCATCARPASIRSGLARTRPELADRPAWSRVPRASASWPTTPSTPSSMRSPRTAPAPPSCSSRTCGPTSADFVGAAPMSSPSYPTGGPNTPPASRPSSAAGRAPW